VPTVLAASSGQMTAKALLYLAGRGLLRFRLKTHGDRIRTAVERLGRAKERAAPLLLASATTGIPPFYATSIAAGLLRFPLRCFLVLGLLGRLLRFAAVFLLPRLF
jgi:membrane protein YqaA with SNARE-associated domain